MSGPSTHLLIGGTSRSGSTVLKQVLGGHPSVITFRQEIRFLADPDGLADYARAAATAWSPDQAHVRYRRLARLLRLVGRGGWGASLAGPSEGGFETSPRAGRLSYRVAKRIARDLKQSRLFPAYYSVNLSTECPDYRAAVEELLEQLRPLSFQGRWIGSSFLGSSRLEVPGPDVQRIRPLFAAFVDRVAAGHVRAAGREVFVDDTPFNLLEFAAIRPVLPDATLVHIYRDPRDVVVSLMGSRWAPSGMDEAVTYYRAVMEQWRKVRVDLPPECYVEIALEDLIAEPEKTLRIVCEQSGLEWSDSLLDLPLTPRVTGRWRRELEPGVATRLDDLLRSETEALGFA